MCQGSGGKVSHGIVGGWHEHTGDDRRAPRHPSCVRASWALDWGAGRLLCISGGHRRREWWSRDAVGRSRSDRLVRALRSVLRFRNGVCAGSGGGSDAGAARAKPGRPTTRRNYLCPRVGGLRGDPVFRPLRRQGDRKRWRVALGGRHPGLRHSCRRPVLVCRRSACWRKTPVAGSNAFGAAASRVLMREGRVWTPPQASAATFIETILSGFCTGSPRLILSTFSMPSITLPQTVY